MTTRKGPVTGRGKFKPSVHKPKLGTRLPDRRSGIKFPRAKVQPIPEAQRMIPGFKLPAKGTQIRWRNEQETYTNVINDFELDPQTVERLKSAVRSILSDRQLHQAQKFFNSVFEAEKHYNFYNALVGKIHPEDAEIFVSQVEEYRRLHQMPTPIQAELGRLKLEKLPPNCFIKFNERTIFWKTMHGIIFLPELPPNPELLKKATELKWNRK